MGHHKQGTPHEKHAKEKNGAKKKKGDLKVGWFTQKNGKGIIVGPSIRLMKGGYAGVTRYAYYENPHELHRRLTKKGLELISISPENLPHDESHPIAKIIPKTNRKKRSPKRITPKYCAQRVGQIIHIGALVKPNGHYEVTVEDVFPDEKSFLQFLCKQNLELVQILDLEKFPHDDEKNPIYFLKLPKNNADRNK